jgi:hypothetical protein
MRLHGPAARLTIVVDPAVQWHHRPVYAEIIHRARREGLAGATALRGTDGYLTGPSADSSQRSHPHRDNPPIMIVIIDDHARIHAFLYSLDDLIGDALVLIDDVDVIRFSRPTRRRRWPHRPRHDTEDAQ